MKRKVRASHPRFGRLPSILIWLGVLAGLWWLSLHSFLLFHSLVEMFSIIVACGIFVIAWNSRRFADNSYFSLLGIAYLFVAGIDLVHTLVYKGMGVFPAHGSNAATQLWISARYLESLSLLLASLLVGRKLKMDLAFAGYAVALVAVMACVFGWGVFPNCYIEGQGLTAFKIASEFIISGILLGSLALLRRKRDQFAPRVFAFLAWSVITTIASEMAFTLYTDVYGMANIAGHFLKLISFYLIYKAIIETGLRQPYELLFRNLRRSQERLRLERNKAREYLNIAGAMIVLIDLDQRVSLINRRGCHILGCPARQIIGRDWCETFVPARLREESKANVAKLMAGEVELPDYFEHPVVTSTGEERMILWHSTVVRDEKGRPTGVLSSGEDITETRRAEEETRRLNQALARRVIRRTEQLRDSEQRYRDIIRTTQEGILVVDADARINYVNDQMAEMVGYAPEELVGRSMYEFVDEAARREVSRHFERQRQGIKERYDLRFRRRDGEELWTIVSANPMVNDSGEFVGALAMVINITERKRVEQARDAERRRLFSLMEALPAFIYLQGPDHTVRFANATFRERFGEPDGKRCYEILMSRSKPCPRCPARGVLDTRVPNLREWPDSPDGRFYEIHDYPFTDVDGSPLLLEVGIDITERKQLEQEIANIAEQERRRIGQDLHDVVGQNLTGIAYLSRVLEQKLAARKLAEASYGAKIVKLVNQCAAQTRSLARGLCPVEMGADGLMSALREFASNIEELFNVSCLFECAKPVLIDDSTRATQLYHIAREAVNNAIRHGKANEIVISLTSFDDRVGLAIRDDGVGLSDGAAKPSGMGLHVMKYRASTLGGWLDVRGVSGGGTVVVCSCPNPRGGA